MPPNDSTPLPFDVPGWAIGDALELARQLPDDSIDCIVTSPPYWGLRSYLPDDHPDVVAAIEATARSKRTTAELLAEVAELGPGAILERLRHGADDEKLSDLVAAARRGA